MDAEVKTLVEKLEAKMRALKQARDTLLEQFGDAGPAATTHRRKKKKSGRREQVIAYLTKNGPTKSADIVEHTEIPIGTLGGILKDRNTFSHDDQGKWSLVKDHA